MKQNDPNILEASPISQKALAFRNATTSRQRDILFLEVCEFYLPKIMNQMKTVKPCDKDEFMQIYRIEVYTALIKWNLTSNFQTYLYKYLLGVYRKFMASIKIFKKDIDYSLFTDISEYQEPTYEMIIQFNMEA